MIKYLNEEAVKKAKIKDNTKPNTNKGCGPGDCSPVN